MEEVNLQNKLNKKYFHLIDLSLSKIIIRVIAYSYIPNAASKHFDTLEYCLLIIYKT